MPAAYLDMCGESSFSILNPYVLRFSLKSGTQNKASMNLYGLIKQPFVS